MAHPLKRNISIEPRLGPGWAGRIDNELVAEFDSEEDAEQWLAAHRESEEERDMVETHPIFKRISNLLEEGDRLLDYDKAEGDDFYRLYDVIVTARLPDADSLRELEGMLDDHGVLVIDEREMPPGIKEHFRRVTVKQQMVFAQGPKEPEKARIEAEERRREG